MHIRLEAGSRESLSFFPLLYEHLSLSLSLVPSRLSLSLDYIQPEPCNLTPHKKAFASGHHLHTDFNGPHRPSISPPLYVRPGPLSLSLSHFLSAWMKLFLFIYIEREVFHFSVFSSTLDDGSPNSTTRSRRITFSSFFSFPGFLCTSLPFKEETPFQQSVSHVLLVFS